MCLVLNTFLRKLLKLYRIFQTAAKTLQYLHDKDLQKVEERDHLPKHSMCVCIFTFHTILNGHMDIVTCSIKKKTIFLLLEGFRNARLFLFFFLIYICQHRFILQFAMSKFNQVIIIQTHKKLFY
jgi:hypothetical protein